MTNMEKYKVYPAGMDEFSSMGDEWNDLLARSRSSSVFMTWEWIYTWWAHFGNSRRDIVPVIARDGAGRLRGVFPLFRERGRWVSGDGAAGRGDVLQFLGSRETYSDFLDLIVDRDDEEDITKILFRYTLRNWESSVIRLTDMPSGSGVRGIIESLLCGMDVPYTEKEDQICPVLELPDSVEGFYEKLKPNMRQNYKNLLNRYKKRFGTLNFRKDGERDPGRSLEILFRLHAARFGQKGERSSFLSKVIRNFHLDVSRRFRERGWLRFYTIEVAGEVLGILYCFAYGGRLSYFQAGFEPEYEHFRLGLLLLGKAMEDGITEGMREFDFLRGAEEYKWRWTNTFKKTVRLTVYPKGPAGALRRAMERVRDETRRRIVSLVGRTQGKALEGKILVG